MSIRDNVRVLKAMQDKALVLWITGLPGSGKSTLSDEIKKSYPGFIILRMDELRRFVTPLPSYSDEERDIVYRCIVYLAKKLSEVSKDVIIDATGNMRKWRDLARQIIPGYAEIYLKCPIEECIKREQRRIVFHEAPRDIYRKGVEGWPVPGMNVPYEEPVSPEVLIDSGSISIKQAADIVCDFIRKRKSKNRSSLISE